MCLPTGGVPQFTFSPSPGRMLFEAGAVLLKIYRKRESTSCYLTFVRNMDRIVCTRLECAEVTYQCHAMSFAGEGQNQNTTVELGIVSSHSGERRNEQCGSQILAAADALSDPRHHQAQQKYSSNARMGSEGQRQAIEFTDKSPQ